MNLKERNMLYRVYKAISDVPGAYIGGGTMTTTVKGVVNFGADIEHVRKHCADALLALCDGAYSAQQREEEFERCIVLAERYIAERKAEGWECR